MESAFKKLSTVLMVDDSDADQLLNRFVIEQYAPDVEILQAYDGKEALDILEKLPNPPDLVFLDINMPGMNGHEFLEKYSHYTKEPPPIIVMLTSSDQAQDREKAFSYNFVKHYTLKPLNENELYNCTAL